MLLNIADLFPSTYSRLGYGSNRTRMGTRTFHRPETFSSSWGIPRHAGQWEYIIHLASSGSTQVSCQDGLENFKTEVFTCLNQISWLLLMQSNIALLHGPPGWQTTFPSQRLSLVALIGRVISTICIKEGFFCCIFNHDSSWPYEGRNRWELCLLAQLLLHHDILESSLNLSHAPPYC